MDPALDFLFTTTSWTTLNPRPNPTLWTFLDPSRPLSPASAHISLSGEAGGTTPFANSPPRCSTLTLNNSVLVKQLKELSHGRSAPGAHSFASVLPSCISHPRMALQDGCHRCVSVYLPSSCSTQLLHRFSISTGSTCRFVLAHTLAHSLSHTQKTLHTLRSTLKNIINTCSLHCRCKNMKKNTALHIPVRSPITVLTEPSRA